MSIFILGLIMTFRPIAAFAQETEDPQQKRDCSICYCLEDYNKRGFDRISESSKMNNCNSPNPNPEKRDEDACSEINWMDAR